MSKSISTVPVILCGGSGTRLWPLSRSGFPKQFLSFSGSHSLFQDACLRAQSLAAADIAVTQTLIVTNEEHRFLALDQITSVPTLTSTPCSFLLEPQSKNTAPALTLAALVASESGNDPVLVVTPADQTISNQDVFTEALQKAIRIAREDKIVILGIKPTKAETGYGYIQADQQNIDGSCGVLAFTEKPNQETALQYLKQGNYFWNSGIFVLKASLWLKALQQFRGDIAAAVEKSWHKRQIDQMQWAMSLSNPEQLAALQTKSQTISFIRPSKELFANIPAESIDYAVMEQCPQSQIPIVMISLEAGWNDLGAWDAVWQVSKQSSDGNASVGDVMSTQTKNTLVIANHRLVSTVGVENLIVIETPDAVLVANQDRSQDVKTIVQQLEAAGREEKNVHRKVYRPWGWYDSIDEDRGFKVKRILVKPGASLSLQRHQHRAEHWIVVRGTAQITNGENQVTLAENQSTYIPKGQKHRLANPGTTPLEIIEVQSGSYLGEDDIERFDDRYGRE